jgi:hypothetical protein
VHPSLTAIQEFAHDGEEGLIFRQRPLHEELVPCQQFCLMVLFDAMLAFNTLLVGSPWTDVLMEVAADHGCQRICPCATFAPDTETLHHQIRGWCSTSTRYSRVLFVLLRSGVESSTRQSIW